MIKKFAQIIAIVAVLASMLTLPVQAATSHSILGTILLNGKGLKGVVVTIQGTTLTATTNGLGNYAIHGVPIGSSGVIVPTLANYSFAPGNIAFTNIQANLTAQNFTATQLKAIFYTITGQITIGPLGLAGATVKLGTLSAITAANGVYTITNVPAGTRGRLVPSLNGYAFTPAYLPVSAISANMIHQNFIAVLAYSISGKVTDAATKLPLGGVTVTFGSYSAVSNATTGAFTIRNILPGTSGVLTPTLAGKTFTPPSVAINNLSAAVHSENFVAAP